MCFELSLLIHNVFLTSAIWHPVCFAIFLFQLGLSWMKTGAHDFFSVGTLDILVLDARDFFLFGKSCSLIQTVICSKVEDKDVLWNLVSLVFCELCGRLY